MKFLWRSAWGLSVAAAAVCALASPTASGQCAPNEELSKLLPLDGERSFGYAVSISGDIGVVGAIGVGAYVFDVNSGDQLRTLTPSDSTRDFGFSVAVDGRWAIVGAPLDSDNATYSGAAYIFDIVTGQQIHKITPSDAADRDNFGHSVDIEGNRVIVGAYRGDANAEESGSAYVFDVATGQELQKLVATDGAQRDQFGISVSLSGDRAIVGAAEDDDQGNSTGSAYIFDTATGQQLHKVVAPDAIVSYFGVSVSIDQDLAIVGTSGGGAAFVFNVTTGQQLYRLSVLGADSTFGTAVSVRGDFAIVGFKRDDTNGVDSGSAYLFDMTTGRKLHRVTPSDARGREEFGFAVSLDDDLALVAARGSSSAYAFACGSGLDTREWHSLLPPLCEMQIATASDADTDGLFGTAVAMDDTWAIIGAPGAESAYVFEWLGSMWMQRQRLRDPLGEVGDAFGSAVAIQDDLAIVGAPSADETGAVVMFRWDGERWSPEQRLAPPDLEPGSEFGGAVAVDGSVAVVGAARSAASNNEADGGSAYVYNWTGDRWDEHRLGVTTESGWELGTSVAASGDTAIIGAPGYGEDRRGSAYMYRWANGSWTFDSHWTGTEPSGYFGTAVDAEGDGAAIASREYIEVYRQFSGAWSSEDRIQTGNNPESISISGDRIVLGSGVSGGNGISSGIAFLFLKHGYGWALSQTIIASNGRSYDEFGAASLSGNRMVIGAKKHNRGAPNTGAAYFYDATCPRIKINIDSDCPSGGLGSIGWTGATPHGGVAVFFSRNRGTIGLGTSYNCTGAQLDLGMILEFLFYAPSDASGSGIMQGTIPVSTCGGYIQMIDIPSCVVSAIAVIQ